MCCAVWKVGLINFFDDEVECFFFVLELEVVVIFC